MERQVIDERKEIKDKSEGDILRSTIKNLQWNNNFKTVTRKTQK